MSLGVSPTRTSSESGGSPARRRALAEEQVPKTLHRGLAGPVLGAGEALLGQLVAPHIADARDERVEIEPVGREEQRAVDVEENER